MPVAAELVPIERPCPVDLDPELSGGSRSSWHCGHCDQRVHVLSSMTEDEARSFMAANEGKKICVTYLERPDGTIVFRKPPPPRLVPVSALSARRVAALGIGLTAALAACTPTERPEPAKAAATIEVPAKAVEVERAAADDDTKMSDLVEAYKDDARRVKAEPAPEPEPEPEPERFIPRPGGITARPLPPPTPPTPPTPTAPSAGSGTTKEPCDPPPVSASAPVVRRGEWG